MKQLTSLHRRRVPTFALLVGLPLLGLNLGCVAKSDLEAAQVELQDCRDEVTLAEATVLTWEQRFDRESERWESVGDSVSDALPRALSEFHDERERIVQMVPEQVRQELDEYLEGYFQDVSMGFSHLSKENETIRVKLDTYAEILQNVEKGNRQISGTIDGVLADERAKRVHEKRKREEISVHLSEVVAELTDFDSTVINCKECPERLRLSRKERETLSNFHAQIAARLAELQTFASDAAPSDGWDESAEDPAP